MGVVVGVACCNSKFDGTEGPGVRPRDDRRAGRTEKLLRQVP